MISLLTARVIATPRQLYAHGVRSVQEVLNSELKDGVSFFTIGWFTSETAVFHIPSGNWTWLIGGSTGLLLIIGLTYCLHSAKTLKKRAAELQRQLDNNLEGIMIETKWRTQKVNQNQSVNHPLPGSDREMTSDSGFGLVSMVSHEIRTPLNAMMGLIHVLKSRSHSDEQAQIINALKDSGDHLLHLANDILDFHKMQVHRLQLDTDGFDLDEQLRTVHRMFHRMAEEKGIRFSVKLDSDVPIRLLGDSTRLIQILSNLVGNAIRFTPAGSVMCHVQLDSQTASKAQLRFTVTDTGIGIDQHNLPYLYEPFTQVTGETHARFGGTGLGLHIVRGLTHLMNGQIMAESAIGKGTSFYVSIPFQVEEPTLGVTEDDNIRAMDNLSGKRVLYVEDVATNRFLMSSLLSDYGIVCHLAEAGEEAIERTAREKFDLILLDVRLPKMDGYRVASIIKMNEQSLNKRTPIVLFSAGTVDADLLKKCGAISFVNKPFRQDDLISKIMTWMGNHSITAPETGKFRPGSGAASHEANP